MKRWLIVAVSLLSLPGFGAPLVEYGTGWRYHIGTSEASSPDTKAWRRPDFDDSAWSEGLAPFGYANPPNSAPEFNLVTLLPSSQQGNYLSVFFRRTFNVNQPARATELTLTLNVDDGFIAWINGTQVARSNVPPGELGYRTSASLGIEPSFLAVVRITNNVSSLLVTGQNVLAIQVFNAGLSSTDLLFDAALASDLDETPPVVIDLTPSAFGVVPELTSIEVVFSENVQGVEAADLLINGVPATGVTAASPRNYVFSFPQPPDGAVSVSWAPNHGITDSGSPPNPFSGGSWSYTLTTPLPTETVIISEFLADNENGIRNDDGIRSDWIEIFNYGSEVVELDGWFLTDNPSRLTKWRFPAVSLNPGSYLVVWASGEDRTNPAAPLHTNFKISKDGGYLALLNPRTNIVSDFAPAYPPQQPDISYGRDGTEFSSVGYYITPTPGARNATSGSGFAPEPVFSIEEGVYTNTSLSVALSTTAGQIRYTTDGSVPGPTSPLYTGPRTLTTSTTIKARVYQTGLFPSAVIAKSYFLVDNSVAAFSSKLPLMIVSTTGKGIIDHPPQGTERTFASLVSLDTYRGRSSPLGKPDYFGQAGISIRGQSSAGFPKKPYRLELEDAYRDNRNAELLGLPSGDDWVLYNPYTDKPFLQNFLAYELYEKMGHYSVRRRFVELFLNTQGGRINYPRDYAGIYLLVEKIEVDSNRVPLQRLTPYDTTEPDISGGYMFKKDKDSAGDLNFTTLGGAGFAAQTLKFHEPKPREITTAQQNWLVNYIKQFEKALYAPNWKTATGTNHYSWYIDIDSFVDNHWIVEFAKQIDGYRLSNYMQKDRNGKIRMEPIWDWNLSFGNADYLEGWLTAGWYYSLLGATDHIWLRRLMCGTTDAAGTTGDPDFNQRIADRWSELRTNVFAVSNVLARVNEMSALLSEAADRDFAKWPRLGTYVWPNPNFYVTPTTYAGVVNAMKNWIQGRYNWIESQFIIPPRLSLPSGRIPPGLTLALSGTNPMYYTVDGSDPRLPGGALSSKAQLYTAPFAISANARVVARTRLGTRWSGPIGGTYILQPVSLLLTEVHYHPAPPPAGSPFLDEDFEFLEFCNTGATALDLQGFRLTDGVEFVFPAYLLNPGARVLVVKNRAAFESRYGAGFPIAGEYLGQLNNTGERITLTGPWQETILDFAFSDAWYPVTDGPGFSLVVADETAGPERLGTSDGWRSGTVFNGSPDQPEPAPVQFPRVVINEALTRPESGPAVVELQNLSADPADISGWFLTDDFDQPRKFRIPSSTVIPPGGFVRFDEDEFRSVDALVPFSLKSTGEEIYLFSGDAGTNLTGYVHGFEYGAQTPGVSFGRHVNSIGLEDFVAQTAVTLEQTNSASAIPPVVINEIMYRPPDVFTNGAWWNNTEDEYIELYNRSGAVVELYDPALPANTWKLTGAVEFSFPQGTSIGPGEHLCLVTFDPVRDPKQLAAFRQKYQVPAGTRILGPYSGNLDNPGGTIRLWRPDTPLTDGSVPNILLEHVAYQSDAPWPAAADGLAFALARVEPGQFGNDPANWDAAPPSPGRANVILPGPTILRHPLGQLAVASQTVRLTAVVSLPETASYQWRVNGANLPGATAATLVLTNVQPAQSGAYSVVVFNAQGATVSHPAEVLIGPDSDRDGIADDWELAHGLNPFTSGDAAGDADGDKVSNLGEFLAGTDPQDPLDYLRIDQVTLGSETVLEFRAAAYRTYTVQWTDSLASPTWNKVADLNSRRADFRATVSDPVIGPGRFYRLLTPCQP